MDETSLETNSNNEDLAELNQNSAATKKPACDYCKRRKIKCDSQQPCFQCTRRGINCEYIAPVAKPKTGVIAKLVKQVDQLRTQLAEQKQIADYWRNLYEDKEYHINEHDSKNNENRPYNASDRPALSESTREFCSNVLAAVSSIRKAFLDVMKAIMPLNTPEYDVEYASIFWNRLIGTAPADLVANIKATTTTTETIVQMLLHSSIFALELRRDLAATATNHLLTLLRIIGSILLIDTVDEGLAVHFNQCFDSLLEIASQIEISSLQYDALKQMTLSLVYTMFYYKINGFYIEIPSIWQRTSSLLMACQPGLDYDSFDEFTLCLGLVDPRLSTDAHPSLLTCEYSLNFQPQRLLLQVISQVVLTLTRNKADPEYNIYVWNYINEAEAKLDKLQPLYYYFFGAWIYCLKAIFAMYMHNTIHNEIDQYIEIALKLYNEINNSPQVWLSRDLEYLHFILSKSQSQFKEEKSLNSTLSVLYNIIMRMSSPENDYYVKNEPNNTNRNAKSYHEQLWTN